MKKLFIKKFMIFKKKKILSNSNKYLLMIIFIKYK